MKRALKVFRIVTHLNGANGNHQVCAIVAATSRKAAAAALDDTVSHLATYGSVSSNAEQLKIALAEPGRVFWQDTWNAPWYRWEKGAR